MKRRVVNYRPSVIAFFSLAAGIYAASFMYDSYLARTVTTIASILVTGVFLLAKRQNLAVFLAFFLTGVMLLSGAVDIYRSRYYNIEYSEISATICSAPEYHDGYFYYTLSDVATGDDFLKGKAVLRTEQRLATGDRISFNSELYVEDFSLDHYFLNNFRNQTNYLSYTPDNLRVTGKGNIGSSEQIKLKVKNNLYGVLRSDSADIIISLVFGETDNINKNLMADVSASGLAHLFAVSGLHIGFVAAVMIYIMKKLKARPLLILFAVTIALLMYAYICGFPSSVIRATVMTVLYLIADVFGLKKDGLSSLGAAGIIVLLIYPTDLFAAGFQMSFLAVFGIIIFASKTFVNIKNIAVKRIAQIVHTSLAVNVTIFPVIAGVFGVFPIWFLLANIIILPIAAFIYIFVLLNTLIVLIFSFAKPVTLLSGMLILPIKLAAFTIGSMELNTVTVSALGVFSIGYFLCIIISSRMVFLTKRKKTAVCSGIAIVSLFASVLLNLL